MTASASTNTVASALSQSKAASQSKPATPTPNTLAVPSQNQSKSDSEMESNKKTAAGEKAEKTSSVKAIKVWFPLLVPESRDIPIYKKLPCSIYKELPCHKISLELSINWIFYFLCK